MEPTKALEIFGGYGVVGAWAILATIAATVLYREIRALTREWITEQRVTAEKNAAQLIAQAAVIERNTAAHLEATKTNEGRAITMQRLVDDHGKQERDIETMKNMIAALMAEVQRRGNS